MSYARFGIDSDVHVIRTGGAPYTSRRAWACINCHLGPEFETVHPDAMIEHLRQHRQKGGQVPPDTFDCLLHEWLDVDKTDTPVVLFRGGYDDPTEPKTAEEFFPVVKCRSDVPRSSLVIGRYSVIPFYEELCLDLEARGSRLLNSLRQHRYLADLGNWYRDLNGITPTTWTHLDAVPADAWPCVLKGATNSLKWQWNFKMFAQTAVDGVRVCAALEQDGLTCDQGIYIRKYVPLEIIDVEHIGSGPPISREYRFFICDGKVLCGAFYWSMFDREEIEPYPDPSEVPREFLQDVICRVGANARFYVVDVAKTETGEWIVIELNDGQMSGLSDNEPVELYSALALALKGDG